MFWRAFVAGCHVAVWLMSLLALDLYSYYRAVLPAWENYHFNVHLNMATYFGVHTWHWYVSSALPAMLGTFTIPLVYSWLHRQPVGSQGGGKRSPVLCGRAVQHQVRTAYRGFLRCQQ